MLLLVRISRQNLENSCGKVVGRAYREDAPVAVDQQRPFKQAGALVVQEVFIPTVLHQLRNDHHNLPVGVLLREIANVLNHGNDDEAIGRRKND